MSYEDALELNPGEQLREIIQGLIPMESSSKTTFINKIDDIFMADGEFSKLVYLSSINYVVRRLITSCEFIKRKYPTSEFPNEEYIREIRKFLRDYTRVPYDQRERLLVLILECLEERNRHPSQTAKNRLRSEARDRGLYCYICGHEIDFEQMDPAYSFEAEHKWPKSLGGKNSKSNLKAVCRKCNKAKQHFIDAADFHYEEICLVSDKSSDNFSSELSWDYRVALWAKNDYRCVECNEPAEDVGELQFIRREHDDSWHFLNIDAYCSKHIPQYE